MIDITTLTEADKDRWVMFVDPNRPKDQEEVGAISSWNHKFIFVKYISGKGGKDNAVATQPEHLRYLTEEEEEELPEFLNALEEMEQYENDEEEQ
jgi:hypothetical protein